MKKVTKHEWFKQNTLKYFFPDDDFGYEYPDSASKAIEKLRDEILPRLRVAVKNAARIRENLSYIPEEGALLPITKGFVIAPQGSVFFCNIEDLKGLEKFAEKRMKRWREGMEYARSFMDFGD